jgi:outer membrane protein TolC
MTVILQKLIEALRNELEQYGEMLALLEQQQEVAGHGQDDVLHSITAINAQSSTIQKARDNRQSAQQQLARKLGQGEDSSFAHLIPLLPEHYRPLLSALVQENNELLVRVRERAQQNQALLRKSLEFMQRFISALGSQENSSNPPNNILTVDTTPPVYDAIA